MIKVNRVEKPTILIQKETLWVSKLLSARTDKENKRAENKYKHPKIKEALLEMFNGKCAYCESKITHVDFGHIEHYRPKSKFKTLIFNWNNLFLACGICNGAEYKGDKFPDTSEGGPFINPCEEDPSNHFDFIFDKESKITTVVGKTERGATTEKIFGLNRHDLRTYRSKQIEKLYVISKIAVNDQEARAILEEAKTSCTVMVFA